MIGFLVPAFDFDNPMEWEHRMREY